MKRNTTFRRGFLRAAAPWASCAAVMGAGSTSAFAVATFNGAASTAVVTHSSGGGPVTSAGVSISSGSAANTYGTGTPKKDKILFSGGVDSTTAKAGAGQSSGASSALLLLPSGMGVDEVDSTSPFTGPSFMVLDFTLVWDISGSTFTPSNTAFNVTVGGTVGSGGSAKFETVCQWNRKTGATTTFNIRPAYTPAAATFVTAGSYLHTFNSGNSPISVPAGSQLIITGSIKMSADDPMDPTVTDFLLRGQSGSPGAPVDCGVIIAPDTDAVPVASTGQSNGDWSDPAIWTAGDVPFHPTDNVMLDPLNVGASTTNLDMNAGVGGLSLNADDTLNVTSGNKLTLFGPGSSNLAGTFNNGGAFGLMNGTTVSLTGTSNHTGAVSIDAGSTLQVMGGGSIAFGAASTLSGAGNLGVSDAGTIVTLNGTSTRTGTTGVAAGAVVNLGNADGIGEGSAVGVASNGLINAAPNLAKAISVASVTTTTSGRFDITNNAMVVRASNLAAVAAEVIKGITPSAAAAAASSGSPGAFIASPPTEGIVSTTAQTDPNGLTTIGFADNAVLGLTTFHGVSPLTAADILVAYTYYGDADLSDTVTLTDFNLFVNGYVNPSTVLQTWLNGDFNHSATVTLDDFNLFLESYHALGGSLPALDSAIDSASGLSAADMAAMHEAVAAVPEPAGLGLLVVAGGMGLLRRNRRR